MLGELVAGPGARAHRRRAAPGRRATSPPRSPRAAPPRSGALARTMEDMRRNLDRPHQHAAAARGRSAGGARRHRRRGLCGRQEPHHPLPEPAGRAASGVAPAAGGRPLLRRRAQAARRGRPASLRLALPDPAGARRRQRQGDRAAAARRAASRAPPSSPAPAMVDGLQVQVIRDETELEAVRRARDSVLANISHEFRTPLAAQLASIELLRRRAWTTHDRRRSSASWCCRSSAARCASRSSSTTCSRACASSPGSWRSAARASALAEVVEDAQALIGSLLAQRGQQLEVALPDDLPHVDGDKHAPDPGVRQPARQRQQVRPRGQHRAHRRGARERRVLRLGRGRGPGPAAGEGDALFARFRRGADEEPEPAGLGLGPVDREVDHRAPRRHVALRAHGSRHARASHSRCRWRPPT